jgi:hypothetical protein
MQWGFLWTQVAVLAAEAAKQPATRSKNFPNRISLSTIPQFLKKNVERQKRLIPLLTAMNQRTIKSPITVKCSACTAMNRPV